MGEGCCCARCTASSVSESEEAARPRAPTPRTPLRPPAAARQHARTTSCGTSPCAARAATSPRTPCPWRSPARRRRARARVGRAKRAAVSTPQRIERRRGRRRVGRAAAAGAATGAAAAAAGRAAAEARRAPRRAPCARANAPRPGPQGRAASTRTRAARRAARRPPAPARAGARARGGGGGVAARPILSPTPAETAARPLKSAARAFAAMPLSGRPRAPARRRDIRAPGSGSALRRPPPDPRFLLSRVCFVSLSVPPSHTHPEKPKTARISAQHPKHESARVSALPSADLLRTRERRD